jgi:hypothetical protein
MELGLVVRYPAVHALHLLPNLCQSDALRGVSIEASEARSSNVIAWGNDGLVLIKENFSLGARTKEVVTQEQTGKLVW